MRSAEVQGHAPLPAKRIARCYVVMPSPPGGEGGVGCAIPPAWREGRVGVVQLYVGGARGRSEAQPTD